MTQITLRHGIFLPPFHPMEENPTACLDRDLEPGRMVLTDPRLVKAELVEPRHQLEVALEALGRVLLVRMERRQKDAVAEIDQ